MYLYVTYMCDGCAGTNCDRWVTCRYFSPFGGGKRTANVIKGRGCVGCMRNNRGAGWECASSGST